MSRHPLLLLSLSSCAAPELPACPDAAFDEAAMEADVRYLAAPAFDGRVPGTAGDEAAREMIADRFECLGLTPIEEDTYEQYFIDSEDRETANVIGVLPGTDPAVGSDMIVVSAHFDHLGDGRLGANDNASGVSGLLAIAQALVEGEAPRRSVVFAAFGSEESGYEGSYVFYHEPPSTLDPADIVYNLNMDMIGTYDQAGIVYALGALAGTTGYAVVDALSADYPGLDVGLDEPSDLSDNATFCWEGIPYVFFWTEDEDCYHATCDTADRVDYEGLLDIADLTGNVAMELANSTSDLKGAVSPGTDVCGM